MVFKFLFGLYWLENLDRMCIEFIIVMGIRKMVIIDDIMCMVKLKLISRFMVMIIVVIVIIMGVVISGILWKKINNKMKMVRLVSGVEMFICINILKLN